MTIGERLDEVRKQGSFNGREFAEILEITPQAYVNYSKDKRDLPMPIALKINQMFNISIDWLLTGKGEMLLNEREEPQKQSEQTKEREVPKRTIISARDILEYHISERELEILQAYRSLPKQRQELFYYKAKAEEIEHGNQTKPQDVKSA